MALKNALWNAAQSTTENEFKHHMHEIHKMDSNAANYLEKLKPSQWSKHAFSARTKCDILQNNIAETFNSFILEARDKPILTMCEIIRRMLMKRFISKREGMKNYNGPICPRIQTKLEIAKKESGKFITYMTGDGRFEVDDAWGMRRVVELHWISCSCFKWDIIGIPCEHDTT